MINSNKILIEEDKSISFSVWSFGMSLAIAVAATIFRNPTVNSTLGTVVMISQVFKLERTHT